MTDGPVAAPPAELRHPATALGAARAKLAGALSALEADDPAGEDAAMLELVGVVVDLTEAVVVAIERNTEAIAKAR